MCSRNQTIGRQYQAASRNKTSRRLSIRINRFDGNLTEINVTSPTGIRAIARLGGPDVAAKIWDAIEKKRE